MIANELIPIALIIGPLVAGLVIWTIARVLGMLLASVRTVRNAWRRFRKKPLIGQRIEPVVR